MADRRALGMLSGLSQGLAQGTQNLQNLMIATEKMRREKKITDQEFKLNEMKIEEMGSKLQLDNERLAKARSMVAGGIVQGVMNDGNVQSENPPSSGVGFISSGGMPYRPKSTDEALSSMGVEEMSGSKIPDTLKRQKENRLEREQQMRDFRYDIDTMYKRGGQIDDTRIDTINKNLNMDINPELEAGRGEPSIGPGGKRQWRVLSEPEWTNKLQKQKFDSTEVGHLEDLVEENRRWADVKTELSGLGIDPSTIGNMKFEDVMTPVGPMSLPARFELVGQYSQDPKYTTVKRKIEQAFQVYRKRVTGAQASNQELGTLRKIVPALKDNPAVLLASIDSLIGDTENAFNSKVDLYEKFGRDTSKLKDMFKGSQGQNVTSFKTAQEAEAANLPKGTIIMINGRKARID